MLAHCTMALTKLISIMRGVDVEAVVAACLLVITNVAYEPIGGKSKILSVRIAVRHCKATICVPYWSQPVDFVP